MESDATSRCLLISLPPLRQIKLRPSPRPVLHLHLHCLLSSDLLIHKEKLNMPTQSGKELLAEMLSCSAISQKDFDRLNEALQQETSMAIRGVSCTCTVLKGNVTVISPLTPGQLEAIYKVFNIPELLEWILISLSPFELLKVRSACKYFQGIIDGSSKIHRTIFRQQELNKTNLLLPPYRVRGVTCEIGQVRGESRISARIDEATYCTIIYRSHLRKSRILHSVLLAQPPPKIAVLYCDCKYVVRHRKSLYERIHTSTGVTFRHMFRAMKSMGHYSRCDGFSLWRMEAKHFKE